MPELHRQIRSHVRSLVRLLVPAAMALSISAFASASTVFSLTFTGAQESPAGDADGTGSGTLTVDPSTNTLSWNFVYANINPPTLMHIHTAQDGTNGAVLIDFGVATSGGPGTLINSKVTSAANITAILANPQNFYVNIHNSTFPGGAIRAQVPFLIPSVTLSGSQEVGGGDPDGSGAGSIWFDTGVNKVFWNLTYTDIDRPTLFHVHKGDFGTSGPVFIDFGVATSGGAGTLIGQVATTDALLDQIIANPAGFYLNVHTAPFPGGAIRGQLVLPPPVIGDLNGDFVVDAADLAILLGQWGGPGSGDLDGNGTVDAADLAILLGAWD